MPTRLLFEGAGLGELLAQVREEHGPEARIVAANRVRSGGIAGFFSKESYALTVEVDGAADGPARPVDAPGTLLGFADAINTAEEAETRIVLGSSVLAGAPARPTLSTDNPYFADILARWAADQPEPEPASVPAPAPVPAPVPAPAPSVRTRPEPDPRLVALGLPAAIAERAAAAEGAGRWEVLVAALEATLPEQPAVDLRAGDILAVAGPIGPALTLARTLAARLRLDPSAVLVAAPTSEAGVEDVLRIAGPAAARRRAGALRRSETPTVVAVDAPYDGSSGQWAREVVDALGANVTWALVDAATKPADVTDHLLALGRLDGIAVRATAATRDPATVLGPALHLGLPTVWLDDRAGDALAWASLLAGRLGTGPSAEGPAIPGRRGRHRRSLLGTT